MNTSFGLDKPCNNCPFRKEGGVRLRSGRVRDITRMMLGGGNGTFPCHKTLGTNEEGDLVETSESKHCAGAMIFAEKHGTATQMMRIAERIGSYNARRLLRNKDVVFDSVAQMMSASYERDKGRKQMDESEAKRIRRATLVKMLRRHFVVKALRRKPKVGFREGIDRLLADLAKYDKGKQDLKRFDPKIKPKQKTIRIVVEDTKKVCEHCLNKKAMIFSPTFKQNLCLGCEEKLTIDAGALVFEKYKKRNSKKVRSQ